MFLLLVTFYFILFTSAIAFSKKKMVKTIEKPYGDDQTVTAAFGQGRGRGGVFGCWNYQ